VVAEGKAAVELEAAKLTLEILGDNVVVIKAKISNEASNRCQKRGVIENSPHYGIFLNNQSCAVETRLQLSYKQFTVSLTTANLRPTCN
jgi:hypothetical protein